MLAKLLVQAKEAGAFARQAWLLPRDTLAPVMPREVREGDHVVVFLHGLFATAGVLRPMRMHVERHPRLRAAAMSYAPGPGARAIGDRVKPLLDALPAHCSVHLVGHSLGGIAARYLAVTHEDERIASTIALAAPFGGLKGADALGFDWARDLAPDSEVLRTIRLSSRKIPHFSIVAGADAIARSPISHALPDGELVVLPGIGHNTILFDRKAIELVYARLAAFVR